jgi:predicted transcriptional regulator
LVYSNEVLGFMKKRFSEHRGAILKLLELFLENETLYLRELKKELGLEDYSIRPDLQSLYYAGFLERSDNDRGNKISYYINENGKNFYKILKTN